MLDGCNRFRSLCRVVLPPGPPGVAATGSLPSWRPGAS